MRWGANQIHRPLRVVLFYAAGHLGSAIILNRILDAPSYEVVGIVKSDPLPFSRKGATKLRGHLKKTGWHFGWLLFWQRLVQNLGYGLGSLLPFSRYRIAPCWLLAKELGIPVFNGSNVNTKACSKFVARQDPDLILSAYFNQILKQDLLDIPTLGALNVHPGWLPAYRGAMCYFWMLNKREHHGGVSVHWMDRQIDTGPLVARRHFRLRPGGTQQRVLILTAVIGAHLLCRVGRALAAGESLKPIHIRPNERQAYHAMPTEEDFREYFSERRFFRIRDVLGILLRNIRKPKRGFPGRILFG